MPATAAHPPVRMLSGPAGIDSPVVDDNTPAAYWRAWLRIGEDREADQPTPRDVLAVALAADLDAARWMRWWDRAHPEGVLTHRADVLQPLDNAGTLVALCGYSQPWLGPGIGVWPVRHPAERDKARTYCAHCVAVPGTRGTPDRRSQRQPGARTLIPSQTVDEAGDGSTSPRR